MKKITNSLVFLALLFSTMNYAQERISEESTIVLSEGDIRSLSHKLRKYKRSKKKKEIIQYLDRPITTSDYNSNFESIYLRQEIAKLEEALMQENRQTNNSLATTGNQSSQISNLESKRLRDKIEQLELSLNQEQAKSKINNDTLSSRYSQMRNDIRELKINNNSQGKTDDQDLKISNLESKRLQDKIKQLERSLNKEAKSKINTNALSFSLYILIGFYAFFGLRR